MKQKAAFLTVLSMTPVLEVIFEALESGHRDKLSLAFPPLYSGLKQYHCTRLQVDQAAYPALRKTRFAYQLLYSKG